MRRDGCTTHERKLNEKTRQTKATTFHATYSRSPGVKDRGSLNLQWKCATSTGTRNNTDTSRGRGSMWPPDTAGGSITAHWQRDSRERALLWPVVAQGYVTWLSPTPDGPVPLPPCSYIRPLWRTSTRRALALLAAVSIRTATITVITVTSPVSSFHRCLSPSFVAILIRRVVCAGFRQGLALLSPASRPVVEWSHSYSLLVQSALPQVGLARVLRTAERTGRQKCCFVPAAWDTSRRVVG